MATHHCETCGLLLYEDGHIYHHFLIRWYKKCRITLCSECESKLPEQTLDDVPKIIHKNIKKKRNKKKKRRKK